jgi:hypothetical protein
MAFPPIKIPNRQTVPHRSNPNGLNLFVCSKDRKTSPKAFEFFFLKQMFLLR